MTCDRCQHDLVIGEWPFCPHGFSHAFVVRDDSIPGGMVIENLGPHPQTFYSRSEFKRAMDAAGVEQHVRHVPKPGSDKSDHTTRWV